MCKVNNSFPISHPRIVEQKQARCFVAIVTAIAILAIAVGIANFCLGFENHVSGQIVAWSCVGVIILALCLIKPKIKQL